MPVHHHDATAVLGAGSWGSALAILLAHNGHPTVLWSHRPEHVAQMQSQRENREYLADVHFPARLTIEAELHKALQDTQDVLIAVPSHVFRETLCTIKPFLNERHRVAWASKGFEPETHKLLDQMAREELPGTMPLAVISGPTFAGEVARGLPTAVTIAATQPVFATQLAAKLHNETFRAYTSDDMVGVQIGGAVKNVLAIAAGIADGLGFGANSRAALITRGLVEVMRLGVTLGGQRETFMGLAGLGDLVLTCTDNQSRNRRLGLALGEGRGLHEAVEAIGQVVEGVGTAKEVHELARELSVEMPITEQVYSVLYEGKSPREAVHDLLTRELKPEH